MSLKKKDKTLMNKTVKTNKITTPNNYLHKRSILISIKTTKK